MTGFYQKTGLGPAMYDYVTGLDWKDYLGDYFGNELKPLNAAYNRMMGETRQGDRIVFYWDAAGDWMGWSFMFDRVTGIGAVADGWLVRQRLHVFPARQPDGRIQELRWELVPPADYP